MLSILVLSAIILFGGFFFGLGFFLAKKLVYRVR